ncbi:MAG: prolyl oligopeptidase family serine peptidase [Rubricoccaceae bacterium]|nr:prolyl oligopeptidase family serine peptidase [Rubricoccaceae bacterium]
MRRLPLLAFVSLLLASPARTQDADDPHRWLEDVEGETALAWVEARNAATLEALQAHPAYDGLYERTLAILQSDDRIPYPSIQGEHLYNFWQDAEHERGLWRRTAWADYLGGDPMWETVLDIDALAEAEDVNWDFKGAGCLGPDGRRCLVRLSRGGADAVEVREFDTATKTFVEDGFFLPEAKGGAAWVDENTLLVATDFGEGSMTTSGYPRIVKRWTRGTPLAAAETVFEGAASDVGAWAGAIETDDGVIPVIVHRPTFFEGTYAVLRGDEVVPLDLPADADPDLVGGQLVVYLRSDWEVGGTSYPQGALIATDYEAFLGGARDFQVVVEPTERQTIEGVQTTRSYLLVALLDNVQGELHRFRYEDGAWRGERLPVPALGDVGVASTDAHTDRFFFTYSSFLQPTTLYLADEDGRVEAVRQLPAMFDAEGLTVQQLEATSADGTRVPYFVVHREGLALDGTNPTLLYGYGGFEVALTPSYSAVTGASWLEEGGVYAVANIRGGGEFGPAWHRAAQKENRQRAFDDFLAVAEDLVDRGITSPDHLGIRGGSNGGLLVGVALTQRPELFDAVVIQVPLLDMQRYNKLLAGASWQAEYGDPDVPEEWAYIREYSPYHTVREGEAYPRVLFTTTTRDDRVHPGHARKMAAKMEALGYPVYYFENTEGGHGAGVTPEQQATMWATVYAYLWDQLGRDASGTD